MLQHYLPILLMLLVAGAIALILLCAGWLLSVQSADKATQSPYECGFEPFGDARLPFDVKFYLVAILFIIFDLETAFLFPWALVCKQLGWFGLGAMGLFIGLLLLGFMYEWKKGALEWE